MRTALVASSSRRWVSLRESVTFMNLENTDKSLSLGSCALAEHAVVPREETLPDLLLRNTSVFPNLFEAPDFNLQLTKPKNQNPPSPLNSLCLFSIVNLPPLEELVGWGWSRMVLVMKIGSLASLVLQSNFNFDINKYQYSNVLRRRLLVVPSPSAHC